MKVVFYSPVTLQAGLGCERWHCDVVESIAKQFDATIKVITGNLGIRRWNSQYLAKQLKGTPYLELQYPIVFSSLLPTPGIISKLISEFRQADVIHFIHGFLGQDILMVVLKFLTKKKIVVGHHAPILHSSFLHNLYMQVVSRPLLNLFDGHMVLNKKDAHLLSTWGIRNVHFIPSGVKTDYFSNLIKTKHQGLNFLSVGRYDTPQKGFDLSVQAIELFNKKYPNNSAKFFFAGSGSKVSAVEDYATKYKNIINLGFVKYEDMPNIYAQTDIFLLSSREEPFGLILVEAWTSGVPVLATRTEGPLDMLKPKINGWFIDTISVGGILNGIENVYNQWSKRFSSISDMVAECKQTGLKFSIDFTAQKMYRQLLKI